MFGAALGWLGLKTSAANAPLQLGSQAAIHSASASGHSGMPLFSGDAQLVVFLSDAANLTTNAASALNNRRFLNVFVHDRGSGETTLVSADRSGVGGGNENSSRPAVSWNGRFVAFQSMATNLVAGDTNGVSDIFVRDLVNRTTTLVSVRTNGARSANGPSTSPLISEDGRYVVFESEATDLAPNATNRLRNVFVRDLLQGTTELVSAGFDGRSASAKTELSSISADARRVAFLSTATNLVPGAGSDYSPYYPRAEVFVRDLTIQHTWSVSTNARPLLYPSQPYPSYNCSHAVLSDSGQRIVFQLWQQSYYLFWIWMDLETGAMQPLRLSLADTSWPSISADGSRVAHSGVPWSLVGGHTNVYLWEPLHATNRLVSTPSNGNTLVRGRSHTPVLSRDGAKLLFLSDSPDLSNVATNRSQQLYWKDLSTGELRLMSANLTGRTSDDIGNAPAFSADGSLIAFDSAANDLVAEDHNRAADVFVSSIGTDAKELISRAAALEGSRSSVGLSTLMRRGLSADGRWLLFKSTDGTLRRDDTNNVTDLFLRDLLTSSNHLISTAASEISGKPVGIGSTDLAPDGRYVAFAQKFQRAGTVTMVEEIFRRDMRTGELRLISARPEGEISGGSSRPAMSSDGQWIAFESAASGLTTEDTNGLSDVFVRNVAENTTFLVSVGAAGYATTNGASFAPQISPDGRWVIFLSRNRDLVTPPITASRVHLYARDMMSNSTHLVSFATNGAALEDFSTNAVITANGRYIVFQAGYSTGIYVHDLLTRSNVYLCRDCRAPDISGDGRWLVYVQRPSYAPEFRSIYDQVFLRDLRTGLSRIVTLQFPGSFQSGGPGYGMSAEPQVSDDGRFIVFTSRAPNLVSNDLNQLADVFVYDTLRARMITLSAGATEHPADGASGRPVLAANGRTVAFHSAASDLVDQDFNSARDIFVADLGARDSDADGIDDDWEVAFFGHLERDGSEDWDGDGQSDRSEFLSCTDPTNAGAVLEVNVSKSGPSVRVSWPAVPGKIYQVQSKTVLTPSDLPASNWVDVAPPRLAQWTVESIGI